MSQIKVLETAEDYHAALRRIDELFNATEGQDLEELANLVALVEKYEDLYYPIYTKNLNKDNNRVKIFHKPRKTNR